jgi:ABC-2 type transport system ATP-binding protein
MNFSIEITSLRKEFVSGTIFVRVPFFSPPRTTVVIDTVDLRIRAGELFGLLGKNGSGKTTLIKIMAGLILPTSGTVKVAGYDVVREGRKVSAAIGVINGDERSFYWRLSGRQNLKFFASLYGLSSRQSKAKIEELIALLEIRDPDKRFQEYSSGLKQRLSIARSLLHDPEVVFMDEPTNSLEPGAAARFREFVREELVRKRGKTVFFATHNMNEAEYWADRLAILHAGRIAVCGPAGEVRTEARRWFSGA